MCVMALCHAFGATCDSSPVLCGFVAFWLDDPKGNGNMAPQIGSQKDLPGLPGQPGHFVNVDVAKSLGDLVFHWGFLLQ